MARDKGGISRMGNKYRKPAKYDIHRKLKQLKQPGAAKEDGDGGKRPWQFEETIVRGIVRCAGNWEKALEELQRRGELDEFSGVPDMHEIISTMPKGDEILKDLGELEAVKQYGMPRCMNPRAMNPVVHIPASPQPPKPALPFHQRPRKRGAFKADVEAGIIPPPRWMRKW